VRTGIESTEKVLESGNQNLNSGQNDLPVNHWGPKAQRSRTWSNFCLSHFDMSCKPFACTLWWSKAWHFLEQSHTVGYLLPWMTLSRLQSPILMLDTSFVVQWNECHYGTRNAWEFDIKHAWSLTNMHIPDTESSDES